MNIKNYHRKINQTKLDKERKLCIKKKYFNNYVNNSYAQLNENEYNNEYTNIRPQYNKELSVFKLTICNNDLLHKNYDYIPHGTSIEIIPIYKKEAGGFYIHNENIPFQICCDNSLTYIKCIRCNIMCNSIYKCLHKTYLYTYDYHKDYHINGHYYDIYYSNLCNGYGLLHGFGYTDNHYDCMCLSRCFFKTLNNMYIRKIIYVAI